MFNQIWWRIKFILFEMWSKDPRIISYTLFPWKRHAKRFRENLLLEKALMEWDKENKIIKSDGVTIAYPHKVPTGNIISSVLGRDPYIYENFVNNSGLKIEGAHEWFSGAIFEEGDVVVDAGANIGISSVLAGRVVGESGKVLAFEPIESAQEMLKKNAELNNLSNIMVAPYALGEDARELTFAVEEKSLGSSTAVLNNPKADKEERVQQVTLDQYVEENSVEKVDFIMADIEGMERSLLKGAEKTIKRWKPKLSICVYHLPDDPKVIKGIVKSFVPEYTIHMTSTKLYAWIES